MAVSALEQARMQVMLEYEAWRTRLLSPKDLAKLAKDLEIGWFSATDITGLWKIGLLRADFITSDFALDDQGLEKVEVPNDGLDFSYCDFRKMRLQEKGLGSSLKDHEQGFLEE